MLLRFSSTEAVSAGETSPRTPFCSVVTFPSSSRPATQTKEISGLLGEDTSRQLTHLRDDEVRRDDCDSPESKIDTHGDNELQNLTVSFG